MEHRRQHHRQNRIRFSRLALFSRRLLLSLSNASATYFMMHTFDGAIERGFCLGWLEKKNKGCRSNERSRRRAEKNEGKKNSAAKIKKLLTLSLFPKKKKTLPAICLSLSLSLNAARVQKQNTQEENAFAFHSFSLPHSSSSSSNSSSSSSSHSSSSGSTSDPPSLSLPYMQNTSALLFVLRIFFMKALMPSSES